jgi:hypothetical protein
MIDFSRIFLVATFGILAVTAIDVLGSITSRKWNYNYGYLTPLSFLTYTLIGYYLSLSSTLNWTMLITCLVGIYDGTVGWRIAVILNANMGTYKDEALKTSVGSRILYMIIVGAGFGFLGYFLAHETML